MRQLQMANTKIETCRICGDKTTAKWIDPQFEELNFLGVKKRFMVEMGRWESKFIGGLCADCKKSEDERNEKEKIQKEIKETIQKGIQIIGGEFAYRNFNFSSYKPKTESQKEALKIAQAFDPSNDNLMLVGPTGSGKSHLAVSIATSSMPRLLSSQRWRVTELLRVLRMSKDAHEEWSRVSSLCNCPLLILEDFGAHKETDWGTSLLWEILDRRLEAGINGLIVTSNLGRTKLSEIMGDRIPSRLSQICRVVKIDGPDGRLNHAK